MLLRALLVPVLFIAFAASAWAANALGADKKLALALGVVCALAAGRAWRKFVNENVDKGETLD